jgi:hypothetical protein
VLAKHAIRISMDGAEAEADGAQQPRLIAALGAWDRALRRDELAAWCITGTRGCI